MSRRGGLPLAVLLAGLVLPAVGAGPAQAATPSFDVKSLVKPAAAPRAPDARLAAELAQLAPQRPGHPDLFVLGFAGDGSEQVFRNEVTYLRDLAARRLDAAGRVVVLANHPDAPPARPLPEANLHTLRQALAGIAARMDPDEDLLLAYFTTHGTDTHELLVRRDGERDRLLTPARLREALDAAGIRHRVLVISACYSGGFAKALHDPDTLLLMAARRDRPSFGCGNDSAATFFGRAWLVEGLNTTTDFDAAFVQATAAIEARELAEGLEPSRPQINRGERIGARLAAWRAAFTPGPALPYPFALEAPASGRVDAGTEPAEPTPSRRPADTRPTP
ncbi:MAG TPA: C13 family peptidase [Arenimonas sp.]|uniref:C13 family peptidase n=1 Tax=Arenimonas sp. TaxID=1872635 RepID=UPI002D802C13|nr:C13 family peptidase [Arenimonas sp.]HEU0153798.1 C13 family peptidase [Arenimonas sp.]